MFHHIKGVIFSYIIFFSSTYGQKIFFISIKISNSSIFPSAFLTVDESNSVPLSYRICISVLSYFDLSFARISRIKYTWVSALASKQFVHFVHFIIFPSSINRKNVYKPLFVYQITSLDVDNGLNELNQKQLISRLCSSSALRVFE